MKKDVQNYEDAIASGRPTKRVRDVGSLGEDLGLVGSQIPQFRSSPLPLQSRVVQTVRPISFGNRPVSVIGVKGSTPLPPTLFRTGNVHLATAPVAGAAQPLLRATVGGGGSSSSATEDGSSYVSDDSSSTSDTSSYLTPSPDAPDVAFLSASALDAAAGRLAARGAVIPLPYPLFPPENIAGLHAVRALGLLPSTTYVPLALFVGTSLGVIAMLQMQKRKRGRR